VQDAIQLEFDKIKGDVRVHCGNRNRFIVTADEKLTAFLELSARPTKDLESWGNGRHCGKRAVLPRSMASATR
jgi:hypothetical protein